MKALAHCPSHTSPFAFCPTLILLHVTHHGEFVSTKNPLHCNVLLPLFVPLDTVTLSVHRGCLGEAVPRGSLCFLVPPQALDTHSLQTAEAEYFLRLHQGQLEQLSGIVANIQPPSREAVADRRGGLVSLSAKVH